MPGTGLKIPSPAEKMDENQRKQLFYVEALFTAIAGPDADGIIN